MLFLSQAQATCLNHYGRSCAPARPPRPPAVNRLNTEARQISFQEKLIGSSLQLGSLLVPKQLFCDGWCVKHGMKKQAKRQHETDALVPLVVGISRASTAQPVCWYPGYKEAPSQKSKNQNDHDKDTPLTVEKTAEAEAGKGNEHERR